MSNRATPSTHITDEREFSFAHHLYPNVLVGFALPERRPVQWMVRHGAPGLLASVNAFFHALAASGQPAADGAGILRATRARSRTRNRASSRGTSASACRAFAPGSRRPRCRSGIDWRLLAAVGYQESKWDPRAASGGGAVGVMMLTADTAQAMGIKDRTDPQQSISAGARYLAQVREMIPERIAEPDRTWLTVAAYNVGFGHLEDARIIAQSRGKNPDSWADVRERCRCWRRSAGMTAPSAVTRAAGSRCSSSIASSAT